MINHLLKMKDGAFLIEFTAEAGHYYRVEYSDDCRAWKSCPESILAGAIKVEWIDRGPPWTDSHPATKSSRFYRITEE
jgi:hypothetical protein